MEADFKGIWGQTWCGAGLWGGHGSFWGPACPRGAPAMLRPLLAQLGPLQPRSAGTGIPTGNRREEFPPAVAGCQEQLQNSKSLLKKKKIRGEKERNSLSQQRAGFSLPSFSRDRYGFAPLCASTPAHPACPGALCRAGFFFIFIFSTHLSGRCGATSTFCTLRGTGRREHAVSERRLPGAAIAGKAKCAQLEVRAESLCLSL